MWVSRAVLTCLGRPRVLGCGLKASQGSGGSTIRVRAKVGADGLHMVVQARRMKGMRNVGETTRSSRDALGPNERPDDAGAAHAMARLLASSLRRADERLLTCLDNLLDCFAILSAVRDDGGRIVDFEFDYANGAACNNSGLAMEQQIGHRLLDLMPDHRDNGLFERYRRVVETGESLR